MASATVADYYKILGVARTATVDEIRSAFRRLALKHHPDRNPGDKAAEARFKEIAQAYDVLSDPEKRKRHDRGGDAPSYVGSEEPFADSKEFVDVMSAISDVLDGFFASSRARGASLRVAVSIGREEARLGCVKEVSFERWDFCEACGGSGIVTPLAGPRSVPKIFCSCVSGRRKIVRRLSVRIPPGFQSGARLRLAGEGESVPNGERGDLYIDVTVKGA